MPEARVLVVDDDRSIVRLCQKILERASFVVLPANSPEEAIGILQREKVDLLLVDIRMPEMDGFELTSQARKIRPDLAVLLMTGHGTVETAITALHRGVDGLILKPFESTTELVEKCRQILQDRAQRLNANRLEALRPIFNISESFVSETNLSALIKLAGGAISGMLRACIVQIYRINQQNNRNELLEGSDDAHTWLQNSVERGPLQKIIQHGTPVMVNRTGPGDPLLQAQMEERQIVSMLIAPVRLKNDRYIYLAARCYPETVFRDSDFEMFVILVRQATVALENARLYDDLRTNMKKLEESQRALVQAEKMSAVGRLLASVAHEINNPLQSVRNCLHLAIRPELPSSDQRKFLQLAQDELTRLAGIVSQMLEFYRPGKVDKELIQLPVVLNKVLNLIQPQLRDHFIQIDIAVPSNLPPIWGVSDQLQQVIFNLILNSMDAMDEIPNGRCIWIEAAVRENSILFWVEDAGHGIPPELETRIFEPFVSTKKNGTGLGLSVSYNIIQDHGGALRTVTPIHNNGARFEIRLPLKMDIP